MRLSMIFIMITFLGILSAKIDRLTDRMELVTKYEVPEHDPPDAEEW